MELCDGQLETAINKEIIRFSGMWHWVAECVVTNVLKHYSAFITSTNTSSQTAWPWRQRQYNLSKHWELLTQGQSVMSQKIWTFSNTTVTISNLTNKPYNSMCPVQCVL
jgi:hypothetical protein